MKKTTSHFMSYGNFEIIPAVRRYLIKILIPPAGGPVVVGASVEGAAVVGAAVEGAAVVSSSVVPTNIINTLNVDLQ